MGVGRVKAPSPHKEENLENSNSNPCEVTPIDGLKTKGLNHAQPVEPVISPIEWPKSPSRGTLW